MEDKVDEKTTEEIENLKEAQDDEKDGLFDSENIDRPAGRAAKRIIVKRKPPGYPKF